jgi:hypothetical protein
MWDGLDMYGLICTIVSLSVSSAAQCWGGSGNVRGRGRGMCGGAAWGPG